MPMRAARRPKVPSLPCPRNRDSSVERSLIGGQATQAAPVHPANRLTPSDSNTVSSSKIRTVRSKLLRCHLPR